MRMSSSAAPKTTQAVVSRAPVATLSEILEHQANVNPHRDALTSKFQDIKWTYEELHKHTLAVACGFFDARIRKGKPHVHLTGNDVEHVVSALGAAEGGYVFYPVDPSIDAEHLRSTLGHVNARGVTFPLEYPLGGRSNTEMMYQIFPELRDWDRGVPYNLRGCRDLKAIIHTGWDRWAGLMQFRDLKVYDPTPSPLPKDNGVDDALIGYASTVEGDDGSVASTSSTTLTNGDVAQAAWTFGVQQSVYSKDDRVMIAAPLHQPGSLVSGLLAGVCAGAHMVTPGAVSFVPEKAVESLAQAQCTALHATAAQLKEMLELPSLAKHDISSMETIVLVVPPDSPEEGEEARKAVVEMAKGMLGVKKVVLAHTTHNSASISQSE